MKWLIVRIIIGICFLKQIWPYFNASAFIYFFAVDEKRLKNTFKVLCNWYVVVNNHVFPHVLLKDLDQIYTKLINFIGLKYLRKNCLAIFDRSKGIRNKTVILVFASNVTVAPLISTRNYNIAIFVKLWKSHPFELLSLVLLNFSTSPNDWG